MGSSVVSVDAVGPKKKKRIEPPKGDGFVIEEKKREKEKAFPYKKGFIRKNPYVI